MALRIEDYGLIGDLHTAALPMVGFLPPSDPRVVGTVEAIERELVKDGFVMRYVPDTDAADGLQPGEGASLALALSDGEEY